MGNGVSTAVNTWSYAAIPTALARSTDLTVVTADASAVDGSFVNVSTYVATPRTVLLVFGAPPSVPTLEISVLAPHPRPRFVIARTSDYLGPLDFLAQQSNRNLFVNWTPAYLGASGSVDYTLPDFSRTTGWENTWGLTAGAPANVQVVASSVAGTRVDGYVERYVGRFLTITP
jgi:hypothetical protein